MITQVVHDAVEADQRNHILNTGKRQQMIQ